MSTAGSFALDHADTPASSPRAPGATAAAGVTAPGWLRPGGFLRRFAAALFRERRRLGALLLVLLPLSGIDLGAPWLIQVVTDDALPNRARNLLGVLTLGTVVITLQRSWLGWMRARSQQHLQAALDSQTLSAVAAHVLRLPYATLAQRRVGEVSQALGASRVLGALLVRLILMPAEDGARGLLAFVSLCWLQPMAALWLLIGVLLVLPVAALLAVRHGQLLAHELAAGAAQQSYLHEIIRGAATIRAMTAGRSVGARWMGRLVDEQAASLRRLRAALWLDVLFEATQQLAAWALLISGAVRCLAGELSVGALMASVVFASTFADSALRFGQAFFQASSNLPAARRVEALLALHAEDPAALLAAPAAPTVVVRDVWFRYAADAGWALRGQSLEVPAGAMLTIRGRSGCGKTTLLRLIAGLLPAARGQISIDGRTPEEMRRSITYLPQDGHLFEGSLLSNLEMLSGAPRAACLDAAARTGLDAWVQTLPMGYETLIAAGGWNVSGGQRQLVLLTAAVASERPLVLLDEAYAHLDALARARLTDDDLFAGKTVIAIDHEPAPGDQRDERAPILSIVNPTTKQEE